MKWHGILLVEALAGYALSCAARLCMPLIIVFVALKKFGPRSEP